MKIIQTVENKILKTIVNATRYVKKDVISKDLQIPYINGTTKKLPRRLKERLRSHTNEEATQLQNTAVLKKRLKRKKPHELV